MLQVQSTTRTLVVMEQRPLCLTAPTITSLITPLSAHMQVMLVFAAQVRIIFASIIKDGAEDLLRVLDITIGVVATYL